MRLGYLTLDVKPYPTMTYSQEINMVQLKVFSASPPNKHLGGDAHKEGTIVFFDTLACRNVLPLCSFLIRKR